jgi:hypothetical protein
MSNKVIVHIFTGNLIMIPISSAGGGNSLPHSDWNNDISDMGGGAQAIIEGNQKAFAFSQGLQQVVRTKIKVPTGYTSGQIKIIASFYTPSVANNFHFIAKTYLQKKEVDPSNSTTNWRESTNVQVANSATSLCIRKVLFDLSDVASKINGVSIAADDELDIIIYRKTLVASDDANDVRMIPQVEVLLS